jgi:hypothetical protein
MSAGCRNEVAVGEGVVVEAALDRALGIAWYGGRSIWMVMTAGAMA